jgi:hypothetical protein
MTIAANDAWSGNDVEPCVLERQAGRIRCREEDVSSIAGPIARGGNLIWIDVDAHHTHAVRLRDEQRGGAIAATNVQVRPAAVDRHVAETPHRFLSDASAVPDSVDETFLDSRHSHGVAAGRNERDHSRDRLLCPLSYARSRRALTWTANIIGPPCQVTTMPIRRT